MYIGSLIIEHIPKSTANKQVEVRMRFGGTYYKVEAVLLPSKKKVKAQFNLGIHFIPHSIFILNQVTDQLDSLFGLLLIFVFAWYAERDNFDTTLGLHGINEIMDRRSKKKNYKLYCHNC